MPPLHDLQLTFDVLPHAEISEVGCSGGVRNNLICESSCPISRPVVPQPEQGGVLADDVHIPRDDFQRHGLSLL